MERAVTIVPTFPIIGSIHVDSGCKDIEKLIESGLEEIEEKNEIVRGIKLFKSGKVKRVKLIRRLGLKRRMRLGRKKQVSRRCEELRQKYWNQQKDDDSAKLRNEYSDKICDYLQEQLIVTFNLRDEDVRHKELGDVIFYYMMRGQEPDKSAQTIFWRLFDPLGYTFSNMYGPSHGWFEISCLMLFRDKCFSQFYKRLNYINTAPLYILYKLPQLLLNKHSDRLIYSLRHLPYNMIHEAITNITDKNKQTCLFYMERSTFFVRLYTNHFYTNHIEDLIDLLLVCNTNGQTALHVNTWWVTAMLANIYTPDKRDTFLKLTSITNVYDESFSSLMRCIENNEYVISAGGYDAEIIIIYNTNNRPGAEEHAQTIYNACKSKYDEYYITLKKNLTEDQITTLIKEIYLIRSLMIVILMSHGNVGTIDDCDGKPIKLSVIEEAMCSADCLQGKPKMLITECCQRGEESAKTPAYEPKHDHFCAVMSCVSGQLSKRGVFLGKLAEQIENSKKDTNIFKLVHSVSAEMEREKHPQTPKIMSTLKAKFCPTDDWREPK